MSKRTDAIAIILQHSVVNGSIAAVPGPGVEAGKHLIYCGNEMAMCMRIAHVFFGPDITETDVREILAVNGLAAGGGACLAVAGTKVGQTVGNEILNFAGPVGWFIKGTLAGSITTGLGWAFLKICEDITR